MEFILLAFVMLLLMGAYWSLVIFPRQRDFSKRQRLVRELMAGDEVITAGGIIGKVVEVHGEDGVAYVEIAQGVVVKVITASILEPFDAEELRRNIRMAMGEEDDVALEENR